MSKQSKTQKPVIVTADEINGLYIIKDAYMSAAMADQIKDFALEGLAKRPVLLAYIAGRGEAVLGYQLGQPLHIIFFEKKQQKWLGISDKRASPCTHGVAFSDLSMKIGSN